MNINIFCDNKVKIDKSSFEVVETKGKGHPDNICDTLAELVSAKYSTYCLDNFGFIPRHMIDKISIIGGSCVVNFGGGFMKNL